MAPHLSEVVRRACGIRAIRSILSQQRTDSTSTTSAISMSGRANEVALLCPLLAWESEIRISEAEFVTPMGRFVTCEGRALACRDSQTPSL